jgi:hypothetical protein
MRVSRSRGKAKGGGEPMMKNSSFGRADFYRSVRLSGFMWYSAAVDAPHSIKCTVCDYVIVEGDLVVIGPRELIHVRCWRLSESDEARSESRQSARLVIVCRDFEQRLQHTPFLAVAASTIVAQSVTVSCSRHGW